MDLKSPSRPPRRGGERQMYVSDGLKMNVRKKNL